MRFWDGPADATTASAVLPIERLVAEIEILGALRFDGAGRVLGCNATMARWLGAPAAEVSGAALDAVLEPRDAAAMLALVRSGRAHVAGRVRLAFLGRGRGPFVLECAVALDASGGALLGNRRREDEEASFGGSPEGPGQRLGSSAEDGG
jgi:PAS domain-containing protein